MIRIEKIFQLANIPHYQPQLELDVIKMKCNKCFNVFVQSRKTQCITGFLYLTCCDCRKDNQ